MDVLSKSDPIVNVYLSDYKSKWQFIGKTEMINDNLNPDFVTTIKIDYVFETQQHLKFEIIDVDDDRTQKGDLIGTVQTTVSKIFGAAN